MAEGLVLEMLAEDFLRPEVVEVALDRAFGRIVSVSTGRDDQRVRLAERLATLEGELHGLADRMWRPQREGR